MQQEGKIRKIGIAGFSLPFLLRISLLVKNTTGRPVDVVQSYAHQTLLNSSLSHGYIEAFEQAGVEQVVSAAPLAMGALTTLGGPDWHPLRKAESGNFYAATRDAANLCAKQGTTLENVASDFGYQPVHHSDGRPVPVVVGCKDLDEVHRALSSYEGVGRSGKGSLDLQLEVRRLFEACGAADWSWASPGPEYFV
jgi:aryl-alcohol dehydrogenase-like predicted oxidoreductase